MNTFRTIDESIFGPTLDFAASTRYSLGDAVSRLRAVTLPRWLWWPQFRSALYGNVDPDRVVVGWHNAWMRDGFQPWFVGRFVKDDSGLRLQGMIGFRLWHKAICYLVIPVWLACEYLFLFKTGAPIWAVVIAPLFVVAIPFVNTFMRRRDAQKIADALDAALA
jgi:hypothetical protein